MPLCLPPLVIEHITPPVYPCTSSSRSEAKGVWLKHKISSVNPWKRGAVSIINTFISYKTWLHNLWINNSSSYQFWIPRIRVAARFLFVWLQIKHCLRESLLPLEIFLQHTLTISAQIFGWQIVTQYLFCNKTTTALNWHNRDRNSIQLSLGHAGTHFHVGDELSSSLGNPRVMTETQCDWANYQPGVL